MGWCPTQAVVIPVDISAAESDDARCLASASFHQLARLMLGVKNCVKNHIGRERLERSKRATQSVSIADNAAHTIRQFRRGLAPMEHSNVMPLLDQSRHYAEADESSSAYTKDFHS